MPDRMRKDFQWREGYVKWLKGMSPDAPNTREAESLLRLDQSQYAKMTKEIAILSKKEGIPPPDLYFLYDNTYEDFANIISGKPVVLFTVNAARALKTPEEMQGELGHEIAHFKLGHFEAKDSLWEKTKFALGVAPNPQQARERAADEEGIRMTCDPAGEHLAARKRELTRMDTLSGTANHLRPEHLSKLADEENKKTEERMGKPRTLGELWQDIREELSLGPRPKATPQSVLEEIRRTTDHPLTDERLKSMDRAYEHYCAPLPTPPKEQDVTPASPRK